MPAIMPVAKTECVSRNTQKVMANQTGEVRDVGHEVVREDVVEGPHRDSPILVAGIAVGLRQCSSGSRGR
jgi:hypothetical protein